MKRVVEYINNRYFSQSERSREAFWNIVISYLAKGVTILCSLLIVPMTIDYVNPTQYGVWLTLSSIISWIAFFDFGLGNGFRNKFAEAKANSDIQLAKEYVSTAYLTLSAISFVVYILIFCINSFLDWPRILNIDSSYTEELRTVFAIVSLFFCLNLTVNLFNMLLAADQKPGLSSVITGLGSLISLISICLLTNFSQGSLIKLACFFSGIPALTILIVSIYAFVFSRYRIYRPTIKNFRSSLIKNIINLGVRFFLIYLCMILIFQLINIVISRELGSMAVTQYNLVYQYFNIIYSIWIIALAPVWSAFTDAYSKEDYDWMKGTVKKYEKIWLVLLVIMLLMVVVAPWFFKLWIGDKVQIPITLQFSVMIFFAIQAISGLYMQALNGIGTVKVQLIIYLAFSLISWPALSYFSRQFGLDGVLIIPTLVYTTQAVIGKIQLSAILGKRAKGIFLK